MMTPRVASEHSSGCTASNTDQPGDTRNGGGRDNNDDEDGEDAVNVHCGFYCCGVAVVFA
jgi:hypothetical protein